MTIESILKFSIAHRYLVLAASLGVAALGLVNYQRLPIDAVPDITNVQVQINAEAPGYSPLEAEQRITFPIETAMAGLPKLKETRSISRYGLSQVTVVFKDKEMDGKSILGLLLLAAPCGASIQVRAEGRDEKEAIKALVALVSSGFGEAAKT